MLLWEWFLLKRDKYFLKTDKTKPKVLNNQCRTYNFVTKMIMEKSMQIVEGLYRELEIERIFLNPFTGIRTVSLRLSCTPRELAETVNSEFGISFFKLLWLYRLQFCRKLVADIKKFFIILGYQKR